MVRKVKVDLIAPPFQGHLHPIIALGQKLAKENISVRILSTASVASTLEKTGLPFSLLKDVDDNLLMETVNPPFPIGHSPRKLHQQFHGVLGFLEKVYGNLEKLYLYDKPDLIIADFTVVSAGLMADKLMIPWWTSLPSPCALETVDGPPTYLGGWMPSKNVFTRIKYGCGKKLIRLFKRVIFFLYRKRIRSLGLKNVYRSDGSEAIYSSEKILCLGVKQLEFAQRWPNAASFIGPQLFTPVFAENPIVAFQPDKKYVLVTLGTHLHWAKGSFRKIINALALAHPDIEFHFSGGGYAFDSEIGKNQKAEKTSDKCASNLTCYSYINYDQYLMHYDVVIHHGGAGIMYHCLLKAIPSIVVPHDYDQFDHAARLLHKGYGLWAKHLEDIPKIFEAALALKLPFFSEEHERINFLNVVDEIKRSK